jgi:hypothetical protein
MMGAYENSGHPSCESILEIMRVTRGEARIYPTVTFEAQPSEYIPPGAAAF